MPKRQGPQAAGSEEDVASMISWLDKSSSFQRPQKLDEVTDREVSRIALAVVAILLTDLEGGYVGVRQHLETISAATEHGFDEAFVFPGKASEKDGYPVTFFSGEGPLYGAVEVLNGFFLQPRACTSRSLSSATRRPISSSTRGRRECRGSLRGIAFVQGLLLPSQGEALWRCGV